MSLRNENSQANQTEFVDQVQLFENRSPKFFHLKDFKKNKNLIPFYLLVILFFSLVLFFLFAVVLKKKPATDVVINQVEKSPDLGPLNQRAYDLKEDLKAHDPTKQSLPFPQVDLEFNIN